MHNINFILFDLYGTLLDIKVNQETPRFWEELTHSLEVYGIKTQSNQLKSFFFAILQNERSRYQDGFVMASVLRRILLSFGKDPSENDVQDFGGIFRKLSTEYLSLRPYVIPLFDYLRDSGCKIGIVSNTEGILTRADLSHFPILLSVDVIILSSEVGVKKPDSSIFVIAMQCLNVAAHNGIFIGDNLKDDIQGAQGAGLRCIYIRNNGEGLKSTSGNPTAIEVQPNLISIVKALKKLGWKSSSQTE